MASEKNLDSNGNPETQFAIVRNGAYIQYGFGGFIYTRENGVSIETAAGAQGSYSGKTAGIRDSNVSDLLQYTTGDLKIEIDFGDFNPTSSSVGDGVRGVWTNRRIFDIDGVDVTNEVLADINAANDASIGSIPDAGFEIGPDSLDSNGEIIGNFGSVYKDNQDNDVVYESGKYYAIMSGTRGQEIVGILVANEGAPIRETSGFIVYRGPAPVIP